MPARLRWNVTPSTALCAASDLPDCPLIKAVDPTLFQGGLCRIHCQFNVYATTSPVPLPTPGLIIAPEIRLQSERYLPLAELRLLFYRLYREALAYPLILSSTPFHSALSWADCFGSLPSWLQFSANPARLLERLLKEQHLLTRFLFFSFLPERFNGHGFGRYPGQLAWLRNLLIEKGNSHLRLLDAACGSGEGTWELVELIADSGLKPHQVRVEGWTLEPLEVWAAQQRCLPHALQRQQRYRNRLQPLVQQGWDRQVTFTVQDLHAIHTTGSFDLIICNGLLGGPLLHQPEQLSQVLRTLAGLLSPGGVLAAADMFHAGWKKRLPPPLMAELFKDCGLTVVEAGEGLAGRAG